MSIYRPMDAALELVEASESKKKTEEELEIEDPEDKPKSIVDLIMKSVKVVAEKKVLDESTSRY